MTFPNISSLPPFIQPSYIIVCALHNEIEFGNFVQRSCTVLLTKERKKKTSTLLPCKYIY